jgi:hypothetical protein
MYNKNSYLMMIVFSGVMFCKLLLKQIFRIIMGVKHTNFL